MPTLRHGAFLGRHPVLTGGEAASHLSSTRRAGPGIPETWEAMAAGRPGTEEALRAAFSREGPGTGLAPSGEHAGGERSLRRAPAARQLTQSQGRTPATIRP